MHQCLIALRLRSPNQQCARCGLTIAEQRGRITPFGLQRIVARGLEECISTPSILWHRQQNTLGSGQISRWVPLSPAAGSHPFAWAHHFLPLVLHDLGSDGADSSPEGTPDFSSALRWGNASPSFKSLDGGKRISLVIEVMNFHPSHSPVVVLNSMPQY